MKKVYKIDYLKAFIVGGLICLVCQIVIDKTRITSGRLVVYLVVLGAVLGSLGLYKPLIDFAGAGATTPITGFGYLLSKGVKEAVDTKGFAGIFTGGFTVSAGVLCAVIFFSLIASVIFKPKAK